MRLQPLAITSTAIAITVTFLSTGFCLSTCQATFVINSDGVHHHHQKNRNFAMAFKTKTKIDDSAVLTELKDTIRRQALEIDELKKNQLIPSTSLATSHGAHGGAPIEDATSYMSKSFLQIAHQRAGWLSLFLVSLSVTAIIVNGFEHTLSRQIELAFFMPLLAGHGGNTGGQTVGTILSGLSSKSITLHDAPKVILKEACSGLTVGFFLGMVLALVSHFFMGISIHVSTCLCCTLPLVSLIASTLGATIPFMCVMLHLEPSVIAAPAMTSFVDVTGLLSYFLIANQVFRAFGLEL
jgi:cation transporter-like permease